MAADRRPAVMAAGGGAGDHSDAVAPVTFPNCNASRQMNLANSPASGGGFRRPQVAKTPARAGHPRARGEHTPDRSIRLPFHGPSPRSRGTPLRIKDLGLLIRAIPALAGNTLPSNPLMEWTTGHPRARGEHATGASCRVSRAGPSPRSRGTPPRPGSPCCWRRAIPALAGNTRPMSGKRALLPGHPRARGEHATPFGVTRTCSGPSPRSRGTPLR